MIEVVKPGLETSIQDHPGRIGHWNQGFPPSGPMDAWSFRLANLLVGNAAGAAGLESQMIGPTLRFQRDAVVAVCGAEAPITSDGAAIPMWESVALRAGRTLAIGPAKNGARVYVAVAGGIDTPPWLGSRSTFHKAGVGGFEGHALRAGQVVPVAPATGTPGRRVKPECRPPLSTDRSWTIEVVRGPNDDWIDEAGHARFVATEWKLSSKSDRTGLRLEGPPWTFTKKALEKPPEHGSAPSNIIDQGYPLGGINLAGQTPIILVHDGPSMGGFINPYTVATAAFWKLGQAKPGHVFRFQVVGVEEAQALRRQQDARCSDASLV